MLQRDSNHSSLLTTNNLVFCSMRLIIFIKIWVLYHYPSLLTDLRLRFRVRLSSDWSLSQIFVIVLEDVLWPRISSTACLENWIPLKRPWLSLNRSTIGCLLTWSTICLSERVGVACFWGSLIALLKVENFGFGNPFYVKRQNGYNIKTSSFRIAGIQEPVYMTS